MEPNIPAQQEVIVFRENEQGELIARIDNLQVGFFPDDGCFVIVWGTETMQPCGYSGGTCPEEAGRFWRNCAVADNCPYLQTTEIEEDSIVFSDEGDRIEMEARIRKMFRTGSDGIGGRQKWPQPAASRFAHSVWKLEETP